MFFFGVFNKGNIPGTVHESIFNTLFLLLMFFIFNNNFSFVISGFISKFGLNFILFLFFDDNRDWDNFSFFSFSINFFLSKRISFFNSH